MFFKNSRGFGFSHGFPALLALALVCLACRPAAVSAAGVAVSTAADMAVSTAADMAVSASGGMACPVCGMSVTDSSPFRFEWRGSQTTFLCSDGCRAAFTAKTPAYLEGTLPKDATDASDMLIGVPPGAIASDGGSLVRHSTDGAGETDAAAGAADESCPVCGMAVPDAARDRVAVRGNQAVLTCTHAHAATVLAAPAQYAAAGPGASPSASASPGGDPGKGVDSDPFCVSGSVMWPGFAWKNEVCTILLFNSVRIGSAGGLLVACLMMIVLGIMVEAIHTFRKKVVSRHYIAALVAEKHRSATRGFSAEVSTLLIQPMTTPAQRGSINNNNHSNGNGNGNATTTTSNSSGALQDPAPGSCCGGGGSEGEGSEAAAPGRVAASSGTSSSLAADAHIAVAPADSTRVGKYGAGASAAALAMPAPAWRLLNSVLFATAIMIGYFLMLAAMTYNLSLFLSVILGLGIGHYIFVNPAEALDLEVTEPCCG